MEKSKTCPCCGAVVKDRGAIDTERYGKLSFYRCGNCKEDLVSINNGELNIKAR